MFHLLLAELAVIIYMTAWYFTEEIQKIGDQTSPSLQQKKTAPPYAGIHDAGGQQKKFVNA